MQISLFFSSIGAPVLETLMIIGRVALFFLSILRAAFGKWYFKAIWQQLIDIGYRSLPVVGLTAIFTGAVLALQTYTGFVRFNAESSIASVVVLSLTRELGPVLAGLMLAGRVGAAIAAELGTMCVTEQIDALKTLGVNTTRYLIFPRVMAGLISLPLLVMVADIIGVLGGYLVSVYRLGFSGHKYINNTLSFLESGDVMSGLIKAAAFGVIVTVMGCYHGYNSKGGAAGVGHATTNAVVTASVLILIFNYIITGLMFSK